MVSLNTQKNYVRSILANKVPVLEPENNWFNHQHQNLWPPTPPLSIPPQPLATIHHRNHQEPNQKAVQREKNNPNRKASFLKIFKLDTQTHTHSNLNLHSYCMWDLSCHQQSLHLSTANNTIITAKTKGKGKSFFQEPHTITSGAGKPRNQLLSWFCA